MENEFIFKGRGPGKFTGEKFLLEEVREKLTRRINGGHTMENKKTAVEWLIEELGEYFPHEIGGIHLMVEKAKQMDKEQKQEFYNEGKDFSSYTYDEQYGGVEYWDREPLGFEEYYNEQYGK
jgi:hypothetical protein